jgi:hypothetical protein
MKIYYSFVVGFAALFIANTCLSFDNCGHKTVATIALDHLDSNSQKRIKAIFQNDGRHRTFVDCATWPDDIKTNKRNSTPYKAKVNKPWHYVNIPYPATDEQIEQTINRPGVVVSPSRTSSANVVTAIRYYTAVLKGGRGSATAQADALSWLVHLVGDVHQPLHCTEATQPLPNYTPPREGDRGGNSFLIHGSAGNLHAYWDDILDPGHPRGSYSNQRVRTIATDLEARITPGLFGMGKTDPEDWAKESYGERELVYSPPLDGANTPTAHHIISAEYAGKAKGIGEKRIVYAGYRLAKLLNSIYD